MRLIWNTQFRVKANDNLTWSVCTNPNLGTFSDLGQLFCKVSWGEAGMHRHTGEEGRWTRWPISEYGGNRKERSELCLGGRPFPSYGDLSHLSLWRSVPAPHLSCMQQTCRMLLCFIKFNCLFTNAFYVGDEATWKMEEREFVSSSSVSLSLFIFTVLLYCLEHPVQNCMAEVIGFFVFVFCSCYSWL